MAIALAAATGHAHADDDDDAKADKADKADEAGTADKSDDTSGDDTSGDDSDAAPKEPAAVAVFDLRPVRSNGQTNLAKLREAVKLSAALRARLKELTEARVAPLDEVKKILGRLYRVRAFDCRESPACLQRMMRQLYRAHIGRVVLGTYEVVNDRVQLTLQGVDTKSGAFTKVKLFETKRGGELDEDAAGEVMTAVADMDHEPEETVDDGSDQTDVLAPLPPPPPPEIPDRILLLGWARSHTAIGLAKQSNDPLDPPYDRTTSRQQLYLSARYQRAKKFAATASGLLEWSLFDHRSAFEATVRELYVGAFYNHVDLRIGNQRIPWGKGDAISPNDILNPRELRDPVLTDPELRRIPTFAARADLNSGNHALQLVVQPFFQPGRYDLYGSNWSEIQPSSPEPYRGFFRLLSQLFDPTLHDQVQQLFAQTSLPRTPSAGARYTFTGHGLDASAYYHFGYGDTPVVTLDPDFAAAISQIDWANATPSTLSPVLDLLDAGKKPFTADFVRRHHVGVDGVTTVGSFAIKLDAAYETRRVFYRPDLVSFTSPSIQAVTSIEYQSGELGKLVLVEGIYQRILDPLPAEGLLGYQQDTAGVALVARWTVFDVIEGEVRAVAVAAPSSTVLQPQIAYKPRSGNLTLAIGGLLMRGEPTSVGDYYGRNDYVYGLFKYSL